MGLKNLRFPRASKLTLEHKVPPAYERADESARSLNGPFGMTNV